MDIPESKHHVHLPSAVSHSTEQVQRRLPEGHSLIQSAAVQVDDAEIGRAAWKSLLPDLSAICSPMPSTSSASSKLELFIRESPRVGGQRRLGVLGSLCASAKLQPEPSQADTRCHDHRDLRGFEKAQDLPLR